MALFPASLEYIRGPRIAICGLELDGAPRPDVVDLANATEILHLHEHSPWETARIHIEATTAGPLRRGHEAVVIALAAATKQRWAVRLTEAGIGRWEGDLLLEYATCRGSVELVAELSTFAPGGPSRLAPSGTPAATIHVDPPRTVTARSLMPTWISFLEHKDELGLATRRTEDVKALTSVIANAGNGYRWYWNEDNEAWKRVLYPRRARSGTKDLRILLFELDAVRTLQTTVLEWLPQFLHDSLAAREAVPPSDDLGIIGSIVDLALHAAGYPGSTPLERLRAIFEDIAEHADSEPDVRHAAIRQRTERCAQAVTLRALARKNAEAPPLGAVLDRLVSGAIARDEVGAE